MSRPDCEELRERLPELVEEEGWERLEPEARDRLLTHAGGCPECAELLRSYRALLARLGELPRVSAPPGLVESVLSRLEPERGGRSLPGETRRAPIFREKAPRLFKRILVRGPDRLIVRAAAAVLVAGGVWVGHGLVTRRSAPVELAIAPGAAPPAGERFREAGEEREELERRDSFGAATASGPVLSKQVDSREAKGLDQILGGLGAPGAQASVVIELPPQSPEKLEKILATARSLAGRGALEDTVNQAARQRLISFEMDAGRVEELSQVSSSVVSLDRLSLSYGSEVKKRKDAPPAAAPEKERSAQMPALAAVPAKKAAPDSGHRAFLRPEPLERQSLERQSLERQPLERQPVQVASAAAAGAPKGDAVRSDEGKSEEAKSELAVNEAAKGGADKDLAEKDGAVRARAPLQRGAAPAPSLPREAGAEAAPPRAGRNVAPEAFNRAAARPEAPPAAARRKLSENLRDEGEAAGAAGGGAGGGGAGGGLGDTPAAQPRVRVQIVIALPDSP
jgi:hypothetical protein